MFETKIAFFGTSGWDITNIYLERFIKNGANITLLVSCPFDRMESTVKKSSHLELKDDIEKVAQKFKIPLLLCDDIKSADFRNSLYRYKPDVIIVCGFPLFLPAFIRELAPLGAINFHSSLLPRHAGMHPGFWTIWYGDKFSGMTVHFLDDGIDTGDIIYSSKVPVLGNDTIESLYARIWDSGLELSDRLLEDMDSGTLTAKPQNLLYYTYNYDINEKDFELDFRQYADVLAGRINMMPGKFYFLLDKQKYYVGSCLVMEEPLKSRKFKTGIPYCIDEEIFFVTPKKYLAVRDVLRKNSKSLQKVEVLNVIHSK